MLNKRIVEIPDRYAIWNSLSLWNFLLHLMKISSVQKPDNKKLQLGILKTRLVTETFGSLDFAVIFHNSLLFLKKIFDLMSKSFSRTRSIATEILRRELKNVLVSLKFWHCETFWIFGFFPIHFWYFYHIRISSELAVPWFFLKKLWCQWQIFQRKHFWPWCSSLCAMRDSLEISEKSTDRNVRYFGHCGCCWKFPRRPQFTFSNIDWAKVDKY